MELSFALTRFIQEVRRPNGSAYSPDSIFYLCLGLQQVAALHAPPLAPPLAPLAPPLAPPLTLLLPLPLPLLSPPRPSSCSSSPRPSPSPPPPSPLPTRLWPDSAVSVASTCSCKAGSRTSSPIRSTTSLLLGSRRCCESGGRNSPPVRPSAHFRLPCWDSVAPPRSCCILAFYSFQSVCESCKEVARAHAHVSQ